MQVSKPISNRALGSTKTTVWSGCHKWGEGRDPSSLCGICKSLLDTVASLGLSSTRKVLSDRYKCSRGHRLKTKRQEKSLRGLGLLSLEKRRKMGDEGGGCSRWDRKTEPGSSWTKEG